MIQTLFIATLAIKLLFGQVEIATVTAISADGVQIELADGSGWWYENDDVPSYITTVGQRVPLAH